MRQVRDATVAYHLQREDDAILCAFGPDFFDGGRKGSACGGMFTAWMTRRTFRNLREEHHEVDLMVPKHLRDNGWTISRGLRYRPLFTIGCVAFGLTTVMKSIKCILANYRYREFVADDIGFQLLQEMRSANPDARGEVERLVEEASGSSKASTTLLNGLIDTADGRSLTDSLLSEIKRGGTAGVLSIGTERRPPSFWDGVAVGLVGSVMDCYLPSKPIYSYYGMRAGMRR